MTFRRCLHWICVAVLFALAATRTLAAVNLSPTNHVPIGQATDEDSALVFSENGGGNRISISDPDAGDMWMEIKLSVTHGTLTLAGTAGITFSDGGGVGTADAAMDFYGTMADINAALATLTYDPAPNFNGTARLTLFTNDLGHSGTFPLVPLSVQDDVLITVNPINDAPVASDDLAWTVPGVPIDVNVKANDSDVDNALSDLTVTFVSNSPGTSASINPDGTINFDPGETSGVQTVTYTLTDPDGLESGIATLTIFVGDNSMPSSSDGSVIIDEDTPYGFSADDFHFANVDDDDTLSAVRIETLPANGALTLSGVAVSAGQVVDSASLPDLQYTPAVNAYGDAYATFTFTVQDSRGRYSDPPNAFTFNVTAVNDAPTATSLFQTISYLEDGGAVALGDIVASDPDVSDVVFTASLLLLSHSSGSLSTGTFGASTSDYNPNAARWAVTGSLNDVNAALAAVAFTPEANYYGSSSIYVEIKDAAGAAATGILQLNGTAVNDAPTLTAAGLNPTFTEAGAAVDLFGTVAASTIEPAVQGISALTLTVTNVNDGGNELITVHGIGIALANGNGGSLSGMENFSVSVAGTTATVTLTGLLLGDDELAALVDGLTYRNNASPPNATSRVITLTSIKDSGGVANGGVDTTSLNLSSTVAIDLLPRVSGRTLPSNASYGIGQQLDFTVTYSENVTVNTGDGTPYLPVTLSGGTLPAGYISGSGTATLTFRYTIAAADLATDGIAVDSALTLNGGTIKDAAGNNASITDLAFASTTDVLVDGVVPTISTINRVSSAQTNATSLNYTVTFSESVSGVGTSDFTLAKTGSADGAIASLTGSGSSYTVTVNTVTGNGTLRLDLKSTGTGIADTAGNAIAAGFTSGQVYTIDTTVPVVSVTTATLTNTTDVTTAQSTEGGTLYLVLDSANIATITAANAAVTGGTASKTTGVTANTPTTISTAGLADGAYKIIATDTAGNVSAESANTITLDSTAPTLPSTVTLTPVGGIMVANVLNATNTNLTATATITAGEAAGGKAELYLGSTRIATDSTILVGDTSVTFDVGTSTAGALQTAVSAGGVATVKLYDSSANTAVSGVGNPTLTVDYAAPIVSTIHRQTPSSVNVGATSVTWRVTFAEAVAGVDAADFALTVLTGTPTGTIGIVTPVSASIYDVEVHALAGRGQLRLDFEAGDTEIADLAGNALADGGFTDGDFYVVGDESVFDAASLAAGLARGVSHATSQIVAQRFTTAAVAPLTVTTATAAIGAVTGVPIPVVTINADNAGAPGAVVATLVNPANVTPYLLNEWTGSAPLSANTIYWIVFADESVAGAYEIEASTAVGAGGSGAWFTNDDYVYRHGAHAGTGPQLGALQIAIGATNRPSVTSVLATGGTYRTDFTYAITATNAPTSFTATGLPSGLSLDANTGLLTGAPTQTGPFNVSLSATNGRGTGVASVLVLTIAKAPLTVSAEDKSRIYGGANPPLTASYAGFRGADTATTLTTAPVAATAANGNSNAGTYVISVAGGVSDKYAFTYAAGILTIGKDSQTIALIPVSGTIIGQTVTLAATTSSGLPVTFSIASGPATMLDGVVSFTNTGLVTVRAAQGGNANFLPATTLERSFVVAAGPLPAITNSAPVAGGSLSLSVSGGSAGATYQWQRNGSDLTGATDSSLTLDHAQSPTAGLYTYTSTTSTGVGGTSNPVIVGLSTTEKVIGTGEEVGANIVHPNGNIYDQVLLGGPAATLTADPAKVTRISFIDLSDDIVQVEFSGAGSLSLVMDDASNPAPAANYNQPGVDYVKGHAGIVITGANETSNVSVFTVGRATAVNQALFRRDVNYDGVADIAFIAIQSTNGKFGGVRAGDVGFLATKGFTGLYAPGVQFLGPVNIGDICAYDAATPLLVLGSAAEVRIAGGAMLQPNGEPVKISGITRLKFVAGMTSEGELLPAQVNQGAFAENGVDVTDDIVVNP